MKYYFKYTLFFLSFASFGQKSTEKLSIDLNTVFVTIDEQSYQKLFENSFVKDTLFFCRNQSNTTNEESYSGKYLIGNAATIEFFAPANTTKTGDVFGDVGIEFKTRKINQLNLFQNSKTKVDTVFTQTDSLKIPWYQSMTLDLPSPHFEISLLEYQKEYLTYMGFTDAEINTEMTYDQYNAIVFGGKKYPRKFNSIKELELDVTKQELDYLIKSIEQFGGTLNDSKLELNGLTITYHLANVEKFRIRKITVDLLENVKTKQIKISDNIKIKTKDKTAEILFQYN